MVGRSEVLAVVVGSGTEGEVGLVGLAVVDFEFDNERKSCSLGTGTRTSVCIYRRIISSTSMKNNGF